MELDEALKVLARLGEFATFESLEAKDTVRDIDRLDAERLRKIFGFEVS